MMITGNESDVADIVFKILAKEELKFFLFDTVLSVDKLLIIPLETGYPILTEFASKCSILRLLEVGVNISKLQIFNI